jgi:hypothetical protein
LRFHQLYFRCLRNAICVFVGVHIHTYTRVSYADKDSNHNRVPAAAADEAVGCGSAAGVSSAVVAAFAVFSASAASAALGEYKILFKATNSCVNPFT